MSEPGQVHRQNTAGGEQLRAFVERIERIRVDKKDLAEDEKLVLAEARASGFDTNTLKHCIKIRSKKPSDVEEARALADVYLDALGMSRELPLFRTVDLMAVDVSAKDQVIEALKKLVPSSGSITLEAGGVPLRLTRAIDGTVSVSEVAKQETVSATQQSKPSRREPKAVPVCSADEAEEIGRQAARGDAPIITNPFPFGDPRRARWDLGWRKQAGNDGMGPDD